MQVHKLVAGVRNLRGISAMASSARVLDLHALAAMNLEDPDPGYLEHPMFLHPVLNRSIIVKHHVGQSDEGQIAPGRFNATKIIFPFDQLDLGLGGQYLLIDQKDFVGALTRHLDYSELPLDRDLAVLRAVDKLPTLDPFLLREILHQQKIEVDRSYYRFTNADKDRMLSFVSGEIDALIRLCFGELKTNDKRTRRLSQLLLADQESTELQPLRETFRMDQAEFSEAMFAWKAFLYYRWRSQTLAPVVKVTLRSISGIQVRRFDSDELTFAIRTKRLLERTITDTWREVGQRLKLYDRAFASLTDGGDPDGFRTFLINGTALFVELGDRIGRLEQAISFWNHRFGVTRIAGMSPDDVLDGMCELLQALSVEIGERSKWSRAGRSRPKGSAAPKAISWDAEQEAAASEAGF